MEFAALLTASGGRAAELAHHYSAAHDVRGALITSLEAGRRAVGMGAPAEAHRHFDRALEVWEQVPDAETITATTRVRLILDSAAAAADSGDNHRAIAHLRRLRQIVTEPQLVAETNERLAWYQADGDDFHGMAEVAETAVTAVDQGPETPMLARALATHARTLWAVDRIDDARKAADRALAVARRTGSIDAETAALVSSASSRRRSATWSGPRSCCRWRRRRRPVRCRAICGPGSATPGCNTSAATSTRRPGRPSWGCRWPVRTA